MRTSMVIFALVVLPLAAFADEPNPGEVVGRSQLPAGAEAAFEHQADGQGLEHIRRRVDAHGAVTYVADIADSGRAVEVTASGKLVRASR